MVHKIETQQQAKKEKPFLKGMMEWYGQMFFGKQKVVDHRGREKELERSLDGGHD